MTESTAERLAGEFEHHRAHLRAVAYRMLGSVSDADDAVQDAWIRFGRSDVGRVENPRAWLTTVVGRVCLDMLRSRASRREDPLDTWVPDPVVTRFDDGPEAEAMRADAVGLALLVVLETLEPAERLAFVMHDVCGLTFDEIAPIVDRSAAATRQLASRARRRVQRQAPASAPDLRSQQHVVTTFLAAVHDGDLERLVTVLDPDIVLRADAGGGKGLSRLVRGAQAVAGQAAAFSKLGLSSRLVLVNGDVGVVSHLPDGRLFSVIGFTVAGGRIIQMNILADAERLGRIDVPASPRD